jgi:hypothetical protein
MALQERISEWQMKHIAEKAADYTPLAGAQPGGETT